MLITSSYVTCAWAGKSGGAFGFALIFLVLFASKAKRTYTSYLYVYVSNETPNIDVFFDNLQIAHMRGPLIEETHYYPFGLTMSGISSKALNFGDPGNKKKYNGIEYDSTFAIDEYEAQLRNLDPQIARWWEVDPEIDNMEMWSPYASNYDNPIRYDDPLGDDPEGGDDCCKGAKNMMAGALVLCGEITAESGGTLAPVGALVAAGGTIIAGIYSLGESNPSATATVTPGLFPGYPNPGIATPNQQTAPQQTLVLAQPPDVVKTNSSGNSNSNKSNQTGSYTNTHESGKTYSGKGNQQRSQTSANQKAKENKDPAKKVEWKPSKNTREAFKAEDKRIQKNGGPNSNKNYNKINSPGKKYNEQDKQ